MAKQIIEQIYKKRYANEREFIRFGDLPLDDIQLSDIIEIHRESSQYGENESYNEYSELLVFRERDETKEEQDKRREKERKLDEKMRDERYETYLKLKSEFEKKPRRNPFGRQVVPW